MRARVVLGVAAGVVTADQLSKNWALAHVQSAEPTTVIPGWLQLRLVHNPGAAFSLGTGQTWIFTIIAVLVSVGLLVLMARVGSLPWGIAVGLLLGGAVGNVVDRLTRPPGLGVGHVVDFVEFLKFPGMDFPVFNLADSSIVLAAILVAVLAWKDVPLNSPADTNTTETTEVCDV